MEEYNPCKASMEILANLHSRKQKELETHKEYTQKFYNCNFDREYDSHKMRLLKQQYVIDEINKDIERQTMLTFQMCQKNEAKLTLNTSSQIHHTPDKV
jgi:hypothetical protein